MRHKSPQSRALPLTITLGSVLLLFCLALTTLWNIVLIYNTLQLRQTIGREVWGQWVILGIGSFFFVVIIVGITLFMVFMSRQIITNQMQKNFIDSVTHELKTPITSLRLYVETLQRHRLPPEKQAEFLGTMLQDLEYLDTLVSHMLEGARAEYHNSIDRKKVALDQVIQSSIQLILRRYQLDTGVIRFEPSGISLETDPHSLQLILVNLLDNAVKYSPQPPEISVSVSTLTGRNGNTAERLRLQINDQGSGIPAADQRRIFNRFYRGSWAGQIQGSGLGLFIVRETVRSLKGSIAVESPGKDLGSTFSVELPLYAGQNSEAEPTERT
ncbi:MAG: HAMP domain-containing histidine kinase [Candidatus Sericytochromatia bacterium]|nr:HAMP domain-containing histidine kinase [Candidatus Sericytochromatia bacterium]